MTECRRNRPSVRVPVLSARQWVASASRSTAFRAGGDETGAGEGAEGRGHRGRGGEREGAGTGHHQDRDQHRNHPGRIVDQPSDGDAGREHEDAADEPRRGPDPRAAR